ncbi:hypothetical protein EYC84_005135 [Monilinia fructicola]|uniref:Uncharacterized protein n=1 Tax=Monilinia fructicola TaxID=38448 RepID=A0A5M9JWH8_MONFR|nr:hypothetical protein EYC84_005135 [Monilinia fructicola]
MMTSAPMLLYYQYPADLAVPYQRYNSAAYPSVSLYDSDNEPLLPHPRRLSVLSTSPCATRTYSEHMHAAPSFQNTPTSEDSIIPAIVIDVIPANRRYSSASDISHNKETIGQKSRTGLVSRLVKKKKIDKATIPVDEKEKTMTKVVYMPRREYLKYFARGPRGEYVGTEPHRRWMEEELEKSIWKVQTTCQEEYWNVLGTGNGSCIGVCNNERETKDGKGIGQHDSREMHNGYWLGFGVLYPDFEFGTWV